VPRYRHYKPKNLGVVRIDGRDHYLGRYDSAASWEKYHRLVAEWLRHLNTGGTISPSPTLTQSSEGHGPSIDQVILAYFEFAKGYYRKNDQLTGETENIRLALRPLRKLYGQTSASAFGVRDLELVRENMIQSGLARTVINARVGRIRRAFRWASKKGLVPETAYHALTALEGLKRGRSAARETVSVQPVPAEHVEAVLPYLGSHVRAMVLVQELAGMRPQDIRNMRTGDIDMSADVWVYKPWTHKTEHHGAVRRIALGPRAQAILTPFLKPDKPDDYVFSPKEAVADLRDKRRQQRRTPITPSQLQRTPKAKPKRTPGEQYKKGSYETVIRRACLKAEVPVWSPNRLRHNCATRVRQKYGIEAAAAVLGNSLGMVAEVYSESNFEKAMQVMREIG